MLSKLKNLAKTIEGYSKSHFSRILNEPEKTALRPPILERFLEPNSTQNRQTTIWKSWSKIVWISITVFINFGSILDPLGDPWECTTNRFLVSCIALGTKMAPRPRGRASRRPPNLHFLSMLSDFLKNSVRNSHNARVVFMALFVQWNPLRDMSRHGGGKAEGNWIKQVNS